MELSIYLSTSVHLFIRLSIYPSLYESIYLPTPCISTFMRYQHIYIRACSKSTGSYDVHLLNQKWVP